jgi:hypothetical protein
MNPTSASDSIVQEIAIKGSAERIFEALTNPGQRVKWWGSEGRERGTTSLRRGRAGEHVQGDYRETSVARRPLTDADFSRRNRLRAFSARMSSPAGRRSFVY